MNSTEELRENVFYMASPAIHVNIFLNVAHMVINSWICSNIPDKVVKANDWPLIPIRASHEQCSTLKAKLLADGYLMLLCPEFGL